MMNLSSSDPFDTSRSSSGEFIYSSHDSAKPPEEPEMEAAKVLKQSPCSSEVNKTEALSLLQDKPAGSYLLTSAFVPNIFYLSIVESCGSVSCFLLKIDPEGAIRTGPYRAESLDELITLLYPQVKEKTACSLLFSESEFESLPVLSPAKEEALKELFAHKKENRYGNIFPFPENMVHLNSKTYINASRVTLGQGKTYICTQGPLPHTISAFWEMVWQEEVSVIVMVTDLLERGREKCAHYWPFGTEDCVSLSPSTAVSRLIEVRLIDEQICYFSSFADESQALTFRSFKLQKGEETRTVCQFKYERWPDFGVGNVQLTSRLIDDVNGVLKKGETTHQPLLVHCSAGIGRTGTFVAEHYLSHMIEQSNAEGVKTELSIKQTVVQLRDEETGRMNMVQTLDQYKHIHELLSYRL